MTIPQKDQVRALRARGDSYAQISEAIGIPLGTIKAYCSRNNIKSGQASQAGHCAHCGQALNTQAHPQTKRFCSTLCRTSWWGKHPDQRRKQGTARLCSHCGKQFFSYSERRRFCCHPCYITSRFGKEALSA